MVEDKSKSGTPKTVTCKATMVALKQEVRSLLPLLQRSLGTFMIIPKEIRGLL